MSALELDEQPICDELDEWSASKENIDNFPTFSTSTTSSGLPTTASEAALGGFRHYVDNDGNHSSEEELEEINNKVCE